MGERDESVTLREYLERIIADNDRRYAELRIEDRRAMELQAQKDKEHFVLINNENVRIAAAADKSVSADTWVAHLDTYGEWRNMVGLELAKCVKLAEFESHKTAMIKEIAHQAGQEHARTRIYAAVAVLGSLVSIVGVGWTLFVRP
jgi:hypothetical protein